MTIIRDPNNPARQMGVDANGNAQVILPSTQVVNLPTTQQLINRDFNKEVARGNIAGYAAQNIQGYNAAVGTSYEPLWALSGSTYNWLTTAQNITISSDSNQDSSGGTGARTIYVEGLDNSFNPLAEVVTMSGTSGVSTTGSYLRVNKITVLTAGSTGSNVGTVYAGYGSISGGAPASPLCAVAPTDNLSHQMIYTVPAGKTWELAAFRASFTSAGTLQFKVRPNNPSQGIFMTQYTLPFTGIGIINTVLPVLIPQKADVILTVKAAASTTQVGVIFEGFLK